MIFLVCVSSAKEKTSKMKMTDLIKTSTHCKTPAVPVQAEGPSGTSASCINKPTDAAKDTNDTTYARKSQSFNLKKNSIGSPN